MNKAEWAKLLEEGKIRMVPKSSCKVCHGRGIEGTNVLTGEKVPCKCLRPEKLVDGN